MFRFKARIARNSQLLRRFATRKLDILGARYEFMNRSELPYEGCALCPARTDLASNKSSQTLAFWLGLRNR